MRTRDILAAVVMWALAQGTRDWLRARADQIEDET